MTEFFATIPVMDIVFILACLVLSAFFSGAETAITSLGPLKTRHLIESLGESRTKHYKLWHEHPGRVLTTILVCDTSVNVLTSVLTTKVSLAFFGNFAVGVATGIATTIVLVFGEVVPKSFAKAHHERLADPSLRAIYLVYLVGMPVIWLIAEFAKGVIHAFGSKDDSLRPTMTEEELEFLINESQGQGVIENFKKDMLSGVFEFDETKVREIMTPRLDIEALEKAESFNEAVELTMRSGHSRIPIFDENIDHIIGVVFAKDLLKELIQNKGTPPNLKLSALMRQPFFVPESKPIMDVFKDLKRTKNHLAIVIDEHGGTAGIVSMEDILEEIVGEIQDEFDVEEAKIKEVEPNVYDVAGSVNVDEFMEYFELDEKLIDEHEIDSDTVAGLMTHILGELPKVGQKTEIGPLDLEVSAVGRFRVERLRVRKNEDRRAAEAILD